MTTQLKEDIYGWSESATKAFETIKSAMANPPLLIMPYFTKVFVADAGASGFGSGAVLMQDNKRLAFFNKLLRSQAQQKTNYEKKLTAIGLAIEKWKHYLVGDTILYELTNKAFGT